MVYPWHMWKWNKGKGWTNFKKRKNDSMSLMVNGNNEHRNTFKKFMTLPMHFSWDLCSRIKRYITEHSGGLEDGMRGQELTE